MDPDLQTHSIRDDVIATTLHGDRLTRCLQCGSCGGSCPNGTEMDYTPRQMIGMILAGMEEEVLTANTQWKCVSCYFCTSRCPQQISITEIMYSLKRLAVAKGYVGGKDAPALAKAFTDNVNRYGRSFELGLASRYYLTRRPGKLMRMVPLGMAMLHHGRMALRPKKIRHLEQLQSVIDRAREIEGGDS